MIAELNYARQRSLEAYADLIQQWARYFKDRLLMFPGVAPGLQRKARPAVWEAVRVLRATKPMAALTEFPSLDQAADDHVRDQGPHGGIGHAGSDGSSPWDRIQRHTKGLTGFGEAINYGTLDARTTVIELLVDDGVPSRGHRQILLDPAYRYVGVGIGPHAKYREMWVFDFAN